MTQCLECKEEYEAHEMPFGLCEDCQADFNANDAEYQLEKAMYLMESRQETPPKAKATGKGTA